MWICKICNINEASLLEIHESALMGLLMGLLSMGLGIYGVKHKKQIDNLPNLILSISQFCLGIFALVATILTAIKGKPVMLIETICVLGLILMCLGIAFFPKDFYDLGYQIGGPGWWGDWEEWKTKLGRAFPIWLWVARIAGISGAVLSIWLLVNKR